ncbi:uncharacterized protein LOC107981722 [Nasonia vitripennis]|uniref:Secreted protein n=1 Tax=Nasonia vitripennis TaxID=7425 RepID=A0A7M7QBE7_NASVI|nr:uncharacterized protein LOC107981722 [Nasonia vitripennis]
MFASVVLCAGVLVRFARAVISTLAPIFDPVVRVLSWHRPAWVPLKPVGWAYRQVPVTPPPSPASDFEDFPEEESPLFTLPCHTQTPWWIDIGSFCPLCRQPRHTLPTIEREYYRETGSSLIPGPLLFGTPSPTPGLNVTTSSGRITRPVGSARSAVAALMIHPTRCVSGARATGSAFPAISAVQRRATPTCFEIFCNCVLRVIIMYFVLRAVLYFRKDTPVR